MYKNDFFAFSLSLFVLIAIIFLTFIGIPWLWNVSFNSYIPYDTSWICGKTSEEIIVRYGEPYKTYTFTSIHEMLYELEDMPLHDDYYFIRFDDNGLACETYISDAKGG